MKLADIIIAYNTTEEFAGLEGFTPAEQWIIYSFRKDIKPRIEFYQERETALKNKYKDQADQNGNLSPEVSVQYIEELNEILNMEVEYDKEKVKIRLIDGIKFPIIEKLDQFFEFTI